MFSYKIHSRGTDQAGVEPLWMVPLDRYDGDPAHLRSIAAQWFTAALETLDHANQIPRRRRLETVELPR
jgi:hypothetical protein